MTMREKIARALAEDTDKGLPRFVQQKWEDLTELAREAMFRRADAVLAAMREPDPSMASAGMHALSTLPDNASWAALARQSCIIWQAMIDSASTPSLISNVEGMGS